MDSSLIVAGANKQRSISESEWSKELDAQEVSWASKEHRATLDDAACYSAWGPDADLHTKVLIHLAVRGSMLDAYTHTRPTMRFVPVKSAEQQSILMLHRTRDLFVRQRTMLVNSLRGQLAEFGLIAPQGIWRRRHFAAWIGLVPQQNGTGGKVHLGRISKKGEPYLRRLLVLGATAVVRYARDKPEFAGWVNALLARRPARVVTVAVANKLARIVWAIMRRGGSFRQRPLGIA